MSRNHYLFLVAFLAVLAFAGVYTFPLFAPVDTNPLPLVDEEEIEPIREIVTHSGMVASHDFTISLISVIPSGNPENESHLEKLDFSLDGVDVVIPPEAYKDLKSPDLKNGWSVTSFGDDITIHVQGKSGENVYQAQFKIRGAGFCERQLLFADRDPEITTFIPTFQLPSETLPAATEVSDSGGSLLTDKTES